MNSNIDSYLEEVIKQNTIGLKDGYLSISDSLPCYIFRELEVPDNKFNKSTDPFMISYKSLPRVQHILKPNIPRKIEFESAVYLKEGIIDSIFPNSNVTLFFIGDSNSDKRFSYNCHRLFKLFDRKFKIYCYINNEDLMGKKFGNMTVEKGWNQTDQKEEVFYHSNNWKDLNIFLGMIEKEKKEGRQVLILIDIDGTFFCPRPDDNHKIKDARKLAISTFCNEYFDNEIYSGTSEQKDLLISSYNSASQTIFSKNYDDEDLTMLITLAIYCGIIEKNDTLLECKNKIGFVLPNEFLTYCSFLIEKNPYWEYSLRKLRALFVKCSNEINSGSPTAFKDFRRKEEEELVNSIEGHITISKSITEFILEAAKLHSISIGYSDRPNISVGIDSNSDSACTSSIKSPNSLICTKFKLI